MERHVGPNFTLTGQRANDKIRRQVVTGYRRLCIDPQADIGGVIEGSGAETVRQIHNVHAIIGEGSRQRQHRPHIRRRRKHLLINRDHINVRAFYAYRLNRHTPMTVKRTAKPSSTPTPGNTSINVAPRARMSV